MMVDGFDGTLVSVPFDRDRQAAVIREQYESLLSVHEPSDVLVLTGSPTSMTTYADILADAVSGAAVPAVTSLVVHATSVINRTDDRAILSDALRRELVHDFLDGHEFDSAYLERAARQESFTGDLARFMETAVWQDADLDTAPDLVEISDLISDFHDWLAEHDHIERGQLIGEATKAIEAADPSDGVVDADAILAVEFEEFFPADRRYLSALETDRDLVCIAARDSSVRRTWMESGPITDRTEFDRQERVPDPAGRDSPAGDTRPAAAATYFAHDRICADPGEGQATVIASETPDEQLADVADEIEALREREGWGYDDIAVALQYRGETVTETVQQLERSGIPTRSATTLGFGDDPAVRELLHVARYLAAAEDDREEVLDAHPALESDLLGDIEAMAGLEDSLRRWATETGMKERTAREATPLEARSRFGNATRAFEMAAFVEETPFLESSWRVLARLLERSHEQSPRYTRTSAIDREGGVRVDDIQSLKNGSFRAVFLLNLVDGNYPGKPSVSRLFPRERVAKMPDYPGITDVDDGAVDRTFSTDSTAAGEPFRRYHAEHARRLLATGVATATERVYLCLYTSEGAALEERVQPSRFLTRAFRDLPWLGPATDAAIRSEQAAEEYLLSLVDRTLADLRRANSQAVEVSLDEVEGNLVAIQDLLDASGERGAALRDAMRARIDVAEGRVHRD